MFKIEKTRIAVIGLKGLPAFGGAATVGENIIEQLKPGYDFTVFSVASHTTQAGDMGGYEQIVFKKFPFRKFNIFVYYLKSMLYCLFRGKYDMVHLHHSDGAFIIPFLRLRYRVICTSHAQPQVNEKWPSWVKFFFKINESIMLFFASEVTAVSMPLTNIYKQKTSRPIHYIPNGISLSQEVGNADLPHSDYLLFAAGRILPLKGLHVLLDALHKTRYQGKLLVIGDLDQLPDYKKQIESKVDGLDVSFIDIIKEKTALLNYVKRAKLFIFPSYSENMSIMLLETALVKTPVICSDIPANTAIFDEEEVFFFKTNNAEDLAEKINYALANMDKMHLKTENAFRKLGSTYNWESISRDYEGLYQNSLKETR